MIITNTTLIDPRSTRLTQAHPHPHAYPHDDDDLGPQQLFQVQSNSTCRRKRVEPPLDTTHACSAHWVLCKANDQITMMILKTPSPT
jgi:hypothetical protein